MKKKDKRGFEKQFVIVKTLAEFQGIQADYIYSIQKKVPIKQIIIPNFIQIASCHSQKGIESSSYIKLKSKLNLPVSDSYQIDQVDLKFIETLKIKYGFPFKQANFIKWIKYFEANYGKSEKELFHIDQKVGLGQSERNQIYENKKILIQIGKKIYCYWCEKTNHYMGCPLLRKNWSITKYLPFKPRNTEINIMNSRRSNKILIKNSLLPQDLQESQSRTYSQTHQHHSSQMLEYKIQDLNKIKEILLLMVRKEVTFRRLNQNKLALYSSFEPGSLSSKLTKKKQNYPKTRQKQKVKNKKHSQQKRQANISKKKVKSKSRRQKKNLNGNQFAG